MEAFGNVEPIRVTPAQPATSAPTTPTQVATATAPTTPTTPSRRSPRLEALPHQAPTPRQLHRMEMEEAFQRRRAARAPTPPPIGAEGRRTRSVTQAIRSRHTGQKRHASPHQNDEQSEQPSREIHTEGGEDNEDQDADHASDQDADEEEDAAVDYGSDNEDRDPQRLLVECSVEPVRVPPMKVFFESWTEFLSYLEKYGPETYQVLGVFETMNAGERNRRLKKQKRDRSSDYLPAELSPYARVYKCTHGPKPKNRGKGQRPRRFVRYTKCPFRFRVQWTKMQSGKLMLKLTSSCSFHNHVVGAESYGTYPDARGVTEPAAATRAAEMVSDGVPRSVIYTRLLAMNCNVFRADVDNFIAGHMSRVSSRDDDEAVAQVLADFVERYPDGVVTVDETDRGETGVISLTTPHMRSMFARFGELLLVDCTHKTNRYNYQLCTFMIMDEYGHGQVVQQSLLETNGDWHMARAVEHLKRANSDAWKLVRVCMVDKDLNEVKILKRGLGEKVQILICHFHVVKYLKEISRKPQFGKLTADDYDSVDHLCHQLIYAKKEADFVDSRAAFELTCERLGFALFADYVNENWFNCTNMWSMYERAKLPHFKNHTNNRLESWFGKFKEDVKPSFSLSECMVKLIENAQLCENDYFLAMKRVGRFHNANYDEQMESVLLCSTPFVAEAVHPEYNAALNDCETYTFDHDPVEHRVLVHGHTGVYTVDTFEWTCDCEFSLNMRLPCRHAMACRKYKGLSVIPLRAIGIRWQRAATAPTTVKPFVFNHKVTDDGPVEIAKQNLALSTPQERYNEAMRLLKPICSELADIEDPEEFRKFVEFLLAQFRNVRQGRRVTVVSPSEDTSPSDDELSPRSVSLPPFDLSQTNSLYSADVGSMPSPCLSTLRMAKPADLMCNDETADTKRSDRPASDTTAVRSDPIVSIGRDEARTRPGFHHVDASEDKEARESEELVAEGDEPGKAQPGLDQVGTSDDKDVNESEELEEYEASSNASGTEVDGEKYRIKINQCVKKSGRPKKNKAEELAAERQARIMFNASEKARRARAELTMEDVVNGIDLEKPPVAEVKKRVGNIPERFQDRVHSKPKFARLQNPTLNQDIFYILPPKLLNACFTKLKLSNTKDDAISVGTPSEQGSRRSSRHSSGALETTTAREGPSDAELVDVVSIAHVGQYSRAQIELMRRVELLQAMCAEGTKFVTWLKNTLVTKVPVALQKQAKDLATEVESMYPPGPLPGLHERPEFTVAALYRLQPPAWLNDGIIFAFCERLAQVYEGVKCVGVGRHARVLRKSVILPDPITRVKSVMDQGAQLIVLPVNFDDKHWTAIFVNVEAKTVNFYDPLNLVGYRPRLTEITTRLIDENDTLFPDYTAVDIQSPIQADGYSCGLFVCFKFWRLADPSVSKDMSMHGLFTRRFEFMHFVLHGTKVA